MSNDTTFKHDEELKRSRNWNPEERWRVIQQTITWAETQATVRRNSPCERIKEQKRKLESYARSKVNPT